MATFLIDTGKNGNEVLSFQKFSDALGNYYEMSLLKRESIRKKLKDYLSLYR